MRNKKKEILFIAQYPNNVSPGQRFRFELYTQLLEENGFKVTSQPFLNMNGYLVIHKKGRFLLKAIAIIKGYLKRFIMLFNIKKYSYIFLQRESTPLGPPFFEWIYARVFKVKIIYDFDDAIWLPHISDNNNSFVFLKDAGKVEKICRWANKVSVGNNYLSEFAKHFNNRVIYNPTCVDTENKHNILSNHNVDKITIGWTGSFSTLKYLDMLQPVLSRLQQKYDFNIKVICNQPPLLDIKNVIYVQWTAQNEVTELAGCQIGLMPLTDDEWSKGKCGFKLIQYLSLEIPAVSSAVGVNKEIIEDGINGFLCTSDAEWFDAIEKLICDAELRKVMGIRGRKKIIEQYSLQSNRENFLQLFN